MLKVTNLSVSFKNEKGYTTVTDHVSFELDRGETLGIVGESGCGKTVTAHAVMGLFDPEKARIDAAELSFNHRNLMKLSEAEWRKVRGNEISVVFQNPMTSLNPLMACGKQIRESLLLHGNLSKKQAKERSIQLLKDMEIPEPARRYNAFPHELSGGMRQRIMIAMALACRPKLLIADEPTTALDVTIQKQILKLLHGLRARMGMALILITHDLGIVKNMVDRLIVMYAGQMVETGTSAEVLSHPKHPYTLGLLESMPNILTPRRELQSIEGMVPLPSQFPPGCRFFDRCSLKHPSCRNLKYTLLGAGRHKSGCQFSNRV